jgi:NAD(P)-dependent dehydrogenase (short-subunit alcohol dehydrogenase family)
MNPSRIAVVTGANRGIGQAIALGPARRGHHVVLAVRRVDAADETLARIRALGGSADEGADTALWLAALPDARPTGGFFRDRERLAS